MPPSSQNEIAMMEWRLTHAQDWENACHEVLWEAAPALFDKVQARVERERADRLKGHPPPERIS